MRPLLNCMQSSCYKVSKIAAKFLKENFQLETRHNIRNNLEPIEGLNKQKIKSNEKLISLDITNMFGEIPKKKTTTQTTTLQQLLRAPISWHNFITRMANRNTTLERK